MSIINHPSQLSVDFVLYNDFHIILGDVNVESRKGCIR